VTVAYVGLGANLGDREDAIRRASELIGTRRLSEVIDTEPWGVTDQPPFLNQVLEVEWDGSARELLEAAKAAERAAGRRPTYRWGPREIDIDVLLFGDERIDEPDFKVPHPGLWERDFVLRPLGELRPDILESKP